MSRTEVRTRTVYKLEELDEATQHTAHEKWYEHAFDYGWWEFQYDDFGRICDIIGVQLDTKPVKLRSGESRTEPCVFFSGFWSQGDGASFFGRYRYAKGSKAAIRAYCTDEELIRITDALYELQKPFLYGLTASITSLGSNYSHSNTMDVSVEHETREVSRELDREITRLMRDLADWLYRGLDKEYEYQTSFEQFKESCEANGYEFTDTGRMV